MRRALCLAACLGLALASARAEDKAEEHAHHPEAAPAQAAPAPAGPKTDEAKLKQARELMEKAQKEADPAKRAALMQEHLKLMRESMGPPPEGGAPKLPEGLKAMQELMGKIRAETDAKKREKLVKENAAAISEHLGRQPMPMGMVPPGAMAGAGAPSALPGSGNIQERLERMEKKLDDLAKALEGLKK